MSVAQSIMSGDPQLRELKKRLHAKRELLKQLKAMYTIYRGGTGASEFTIYREGGTVRY